MARDFSCRCRGSCACTPDGNRRLSAALRAPLPETWRVSRNPESGRAGKYAGNARSLVLESYNRSDRYYRIILREVLTVIITPGIKRARWTVPQEDWPFHIQLRPSNIEHERN